MTIYDSIAADTLHPKKKKKKKKKNSPKPCLVDGVRRQYRVISCRRGDYLIAHTSRCIAKKRFKKRIWLENHHSPLSLAVLTM
jgi:hypothetical protein